MLSIYHSKSNIVPCLPLLVFPKRQFHAGIQNQCDEWTQGCDLLKLGELLVSTYPGFFLLSLPFLI